METQTWILVLVIIILGPTLAAFGKKYIPKWLRITIAVVSILAFIGVFIWAAA